MFFFLVSSNLSSSLRVIVFVLLLFFVILCFSPLCFIFYFGFLFLFTLDMKNSENIISKPWVFMKDSKSGFFHLVMFYARPVCLSSHEAECLRVDELHYIPFSLSFFPFYFIRKQRRVKERFILKLRKHYSIEKNPSFQNLL